MICCTCPSPESYFLDSTSIFKMGMCNQGVNRCPTNQSQPGVSIIWHLHWSMSECVPVNSHKFRKTSDCSALQKTRFFFFLLPSWSIYNQISQFKPPYLLDSTAQRRGPIPDGASVLMTVTIINRTHMQQICVDKSRSKFLQVRQSQNNSKSSTTSPFCHGLTSSVVMILEQMKQTSSSQTLGQDLDMAIFPSEANFIHGHHI
jgi:hypothetical protein